MGEQLTMLDTMFLELEQADDAAHMHIGGALVFESLPDGGSPDLARVRRHMRERLSALPRFAQQLSGVHAGPLTWLTWEPAAPLDPDAHVHHATLPAPGTDEQLRAWLGDFWSHRLDRHRPLWEMVLLDGLEGGRWALATKTHHCLVDGVGSLDIGHVLLDATADVPESTGAAAPDVAPVEAHGNGRFWLHPSHVVRSARAGASAVLHPRASLDRARAAVELIAREEIVPAPACSLNGAMSGTRHYANVRFDLAEVKAVKSRLGGTVNDVVLAVCAGGLRHLLLARGDTLPDRPLRAQVPVNVRPGEHEHDLGNELTSLFVELPLAEPDALERYRAVTRRAAALKAGSQQEGGRAIIALADLGPPLAGAIVARSMFGGARMFNLTITNVPGPQQRLYAFGAPLAEILPLVPLFAGHTVGIAVLSYAGGVVVGINADRMGAPDVDVLAEGLEEAFAELAAVPASSGTPELTQVPASP